MHLPREGAAALGSLGTGLAITGLFGAPAVVAVDGIAVSQMAQPGANAEEMAALLGRIKESAGLRAVAVVGALSFPGGVLLLAYALWRSRVTAHWVSGGIAVAGSTVFAGQVTDNRSIFAIAFAIAFAIYLLVLGPLGWGILNGSDEEWAGSPMHPVAGGDGSPKPGG